jgi:hypothetical protein
MMWLSQTNRQILCVYVLFTLLHLHLYSESELVPLDAVRVPNKLLLLTALRSV